jgi:hypothetical protein
VSGQQQGCKTGQHEKGNGIFIHKSHPENGEQQQPDFGISGIDQSQQQVSGQQPEKLVEGYRLEERIGPQKGSG